ncbi:MAG: CPBP family intramembrane glutamic endopeptidase [Saonia sp.]
MNRVRQITKAVIKKRTIIVFILTILLGYVLFSLGHMPVSALDWFDILIPTLIYTVLLITTKRLTASIVAHGIYNITAIIVTHHLYFN